MAPKLGERDGTRTCDLCGVNQCASQASYAPKPNRRCEASENHSSRKKEIQRENAAQKETMCSAF